MILINYSYLFAKNIEIKVILQNEIITNIDIKTQTIIGILYFIFGSIYITTPYLVTISYFNLLLAITCFTISCYMHKYQISEWYYFHIFFHIFVIFNKIIFYLEM